MSNNTAEIPIHGVVINRRGDCITLLEMASNGRVSVIDGGDGLRVLVMVNDGSGGGGGDGERLTVMNRR